MAETKKSSKFFTPGWIQVVVAFVVAIVTQGFGIYHFGMLKVPMTEALGAQPAEVSASPSTPWRRVSQAWW